MMECNEAVERQKLVSNDAETDDVPSSAPKSSIQTPISPVLSSKVFSSGDTSRSQNSTTCSVGKGHPEAGQQATKLTFVNERKLEAIAKAKAKKIHRGIPPRARSRPISHASFYRLFLCILFGFICDSSFIYFMASTHTLFGLVSLARAFSVDLPSPKTVQAPTHPVHSSNFSFADRPLKHHSFISDDGSVRNMERALLGLLEDFHSGKLRAFGSGCTMEQMTDIREQQERLAKLHFELGGGDASEDAQAEHGAQKMSQLVMKLENLSVSIEKLHSSNSDL
ncbi:uncharacterized protein LOC132262160 [Phlebotomus argentipes]|uniref:uncharacterized protein LOC132262160 n=1 Tax=Phlebotomus argentipes TaxID=94469 RepID=UPI002892B0C6|nr:uncharacterized protein LOC132262160 [Phlebotomus argentipes]